MKKPCNMTPAERRAEALRVFRCIGPMVIAVVLVLLVVLNHQEVFFPDNYTESH